MLKHNVWLQQNGISFSYLSGKSKQFSFVRNVLSIHSKNKTKEDFSSKTRPHCGKFFCTRCFSLHMFCVFFFLYACLFAIFLYLNVARMSSGSAIHMKQFCNFLQKKCNWKFTFQYKCKIIAKFCYPKSSKFLLSDTNKMQFHGK